jgi:hypothetical protein
MQGTPIAFRSHRSRAIPVVLMWLLVLLIVVSIVATVVARRHTRDARDSVDAQQRQLDALRIAATASQAPSGERTTAPLPIPGRGLPRSSRGPDHPRRWLLIGGGLVAIAAIGAVVLASGVGDSSSGSGGGQRAATRRTSTSTSSTSTTTTTVAPAVTVGPLQQGTVAVSMPAGPYQVAVTARGACWMQAQGPDKTVIATSTLQAGETKQIPGSGAMTLRLGNPGNVDVQLNGTALALPPTGGAAMDVQLNPAA